MSNAQTRFSIPEGTVPLVEVHGTSFECGEQLGIYWRQLAHETFASAPDGERPWFERSDTAEAKAFDRHAPHLRELYRGMMRSANIANPRLPASRTHSGPAGERPPATPVKTACSSYALNGTFTADGSPLAGQNKDTGWGSAFRYVVLKVCSTDGPGTFSLTYPLDLLGYGSSATGLCIFRNSMPGEPQPGFPWVSWCLMAKCKQTVAEAVELFRQLAVGGCANFLLADRFGGMADIELGAGRTNVLTPSAGLLAHTNHFVDPVLTDDSFPGEAEHSVHRLAIMKTRFEAERGRLNWMGALHCMSDHEKHPMSLCRHETPARRGFMTTASVVAEPAKGRLHVVRGPPCSNPPVTHTMSSITAISAFNIRSRGCVGPGASVSSSTASASTECADAGRR
ncbi:MAG: hypothetical protein HY360_14425 [Verrucomicrobia bacterium]|nr:hypothetical protein [Verrucomicrobiota bacterium]